MVGDRRLTVAALLGISTIIAGSMFLCGCSTAAPKSPKAGGVTSAKEGIVQESLVVPTKELHRRADTAAEPLKAEPGPAQSESPVAAKPKEQGSAPSGDYQIGPGDALDFRSFDDESLNTRVVVRYDGCISLPMIPDVNVLNATRTEATERLREAYSKEFKSPRISLSVTQAQSKVYYVMGEVNRAAEYPYTRPISVIDAITAAGGQRISQGWGGSGGGSASYVSAQGQLTKALIIRHTNGQRDVLECALNNFVKPGDHPSDTLVLPGDILYVPEGANLAYVLGEVRRPDVFQLTEGTTLLQLLVRAGGPVEQTGRISQVVVMHEVDADSTRIELVNVRQILKTGADPKVQPGDIIYIPRKRMVQLQEFVSRFTGTVSPVMDLFMRAYETYYTPERYKRIYRTSSSSASSTSQQDLLAIEQVVRDASSLSTLLSTGR